VTLKSVESLVEYTIRVFEVEKVLIIITMLIYSKMVCSGKYKSRCCGGAPVSLQSVA